MTFPRSWLLTFAFVACHPSLPTRPTPIGVTTTRGAAPLRGTPEADDAAKALANASYPSVRAALEAGIRGSHRNPGAADRDKYRHPVETLSFFGIEPTMTVLDVGCNAGFFCLEMKKRGARYEKGLIPFRSYVVVDGRLVTGQNPGSAKATAEKVVEVLEA